MTKRRRTILGGLLVACAAVAVVWFLRHDQDIDDRHVILHGNVDIREVELAFNGSERIAALYATEGESVQPGQLLGELEKERLIADEARAQAELASQEQILRRLEKGSRAEEIRKAHADVAAAQADLERLQLRLARSEKLVAVDAVAQQKLEDDRAGFEMTKARLKALRAARDLVLAGPREEDIAAARARRDALRASLALARKRLADADLRAPGPGVIRNRILEPGDMASPQRPVYTLALTDPLWVRIYIEEPDLGRVKLGHRAVVSTDSYPGKQYEGWAGYVSPTAEFTPKPVETREVRSHLVYQARIYVCNPNGELRLGMPATVRIDVTEAPQSHPGCGEP